jgi:inner membrane protein
MESTIQNVWSKSKVLVKGLIIGFLVLLLIIPTLFVQNLVEEREQRQKEAIIEVSSKWAGQQVVTGPFIVLPYWQTDSDTAIKKVRSKHFAYFLPDLLSVNATVTPREKYRGIYKVMLYNSKINLSGSFNGVNLQQLNILPEDVIWNEAFVKFNLADVKGLNEEMILTWNQQKLVLSPQSFDDNSGSNGLTATLPLNDSGQLGVIDFSSQIDINGSEQLLFTPVGKSTAVAIQSSWPHPSFKGDILPQTSQVKENGFSATWKSLAHKRAFPQQWKDNAYVLGNVPGNTNSTTRTIDVVTAGNHISSAAFGTDLFVPVNNYQKTMRSVKYAVLCILLTFSAFFLIETTNKRSVHPFQYGLIGMALIVFYVLLLSFSEYVGFTTSYIIASLATVGLIGWFAKSILVSGRLSGVLSVVLVLMYTYIFTLLQLQDYSLLFGSIGLFITLAVIMYFSRKIQW